MRPEVVVRPSRAPPSPRPSRPPSGPSSWPRRHWTLVKVAFRLALIVMTLSLFACRDVSSVDGLADVRFGLPFPFVSLDARGRPPATLPRCVRLGDPRLSPVQLLPLAAFADLASLTAALVAVPLAWRRVRSRHR